MFEILSILAFYLSLIVSRLSLLVSYFFVLNVPQKSFLRH